MGAYVMLDARVELNAVVLSSFVRQVTLNVEADEQDTTAFGTNGYKSILAGLRQFSVELEVNQDFAAAAVDATIWPLFGTTTTVKIRPTSAVISATNPEYTGSVSILGYTPLDGAVGDVSTTSIPLSGAGALTRNIA